MSMYVICHYIPFTIRHLSSYFICRYITFVIISHLSARVICQYMTFVIMCHLRLNLICNYVFAFPAIFLRFYVTCNMLHGIEKSTATQVLGKRAPSYIYHSGDPYTQNVLPYPYRLSHKLPMVRCTIVVAEESYALFQPSDILLRPQCWG